MEINKFNQTMKYLTRPAERPAKTLSDDPLETPPVFQTGDPQEAVKEVITRAGGGAPVSIGIAPGVELNPLGTIEDQDPSLTGRFGVGGGELEFGVKEDEGFIGFRKQFDEGGVVEREGFRKGSPRNPFTQEELDIFNTVNQTKYKLGEDQKILDKFGRQYTIQKANIRRGGLTAETRRGIQSTGLATENPAYVKETKKVLKNLVEKKNGEKFISYNDSAGDAKFKETDLHKKLTKSGVIKIKNRDNLNKLIRNYLNTEGVLDKNQYRRAVVVKSFLKYLDDNKTFDGGEKFIEKLKEFRGKSGKTFETINRVFTDWANGDFEVEGVNRSKISAKNLEEINNYNPTRLQERSGVKINQLKTLNNYNNNSNLTLNRARSLFNRKHIRDENFTTKTFFQRVFQLTEIKQAGGTSNAKTGQMIKYPGLNKGPRSPWLKQGLSGVFGGNYGNMIAAGDQLMAEGKSKRAKVLYKTANDFFGPNGKFTKMKGQGEHPLPRSIGGPDVELKINSLVSEDLNNFKRNNFDIPVLNHVNEYNNPATSLTRKKQLQNLIENKKNFINSLTSSKEYGGILDPVKFTYKDKVTFNVDVKDLNKYPKGFSFDDFVKRGEAYRSTFLEKGKQFTKAGQIQDIFVSDKTMQKIPRTTQFYSGLAALPEMGRIGKEMITQDVPKFGRFAGQVAKGAKGTLKLAGKGARMLVGPVELPVSIAAGGLYENYQNQLDYAKALDRTNLSENKKNDLKNKFRRAELGLDVGVGEEILVDTMGTESDIIGGIKDPDKIGQFQKKAFDAINAERAVQAEKLEQQRKEAQTIKFDEDFDVL